MATGSKRFFDSHGSMKQRSSASHSSASQAKERKEKYSCRKQEGLQAHMRSLHLTSAYTAPSLACSDCGKANLKGADALHQHQWASVNHTRVSKTPNPSPGTRARACSQCNMKLPTAEDLEQHFAEHHPISEVQKSTSEDRTWQQVEDRFQSAWKNPTTKLNKVHRIFKVYISGWKQADFEQYRKEVKVQMSNRKLIKEENLELRNKVLSNGNELLRYHGTTIKCRLGQPPNPKDNAVLSLCMDKGCNFCQIVKTGFKKTKCRVHRFQRFGKGIYCSATSSKASAYVKHGKAVKKASNSFKWPFCSCLIRGGDAREGNFKVMMVCKVIAGRPYHSTQNLQDLKSPPYGFHSVQGDPGQELNYDELVVYEDRAILLAYIILYSSRE